MKIYQYITKLLFGSYPVNTSLIFIYLKSLKKLRYKIIQLISSSFFSNFLTISYHKVSHLICNCIKLSTFKYDLIVKWGTPKIKKVHNLCFTEYREKDRASLAYLLDANCSGRSRAFANVNAPRFHLERFERTLLCSHKCSRKYDDFNLFFRFFISLYGFRVFGFDGAE